MANALPAAFDRLLRAVLVTNLGDGLRMVALPLLATRLTDSPLLIGAVTAAQFLPWLLVAPLIGGLVDAVDRCRLIVRVQWFRGLVLLGLTVAVFADLASLWQVYAVAFLVTSGEILVDPALVAMTPTIVDSADLDRANGRLSAVEMTTNEFIGGPLGAFLFTLAPWLPFLADSASYGGSTVFFRGLPSEPSQRQARSVRSLVRDMGDATRWLLRHRFLRPWIWAVALSYVGTAAAFAMLVVLALDEVGVSERAFGFVLAAGAAGGVIGAAAAGWLTDRVRRAVAIPVVAAVSGLTLVMTAGAVSGLLLGIAWFTNGLATGVSLAVGRGVQQRVIPNELLGRVNIASRTITRSAFVVGAVIGGAVAIGSVRLTFVVAGAIQIVGATLMARAIRRTDVLD